MKSGVPDFGYAPSRYSFFRSHSDSTLLIQQAAAVCSAEFHAVRAFFAPDGTTMLIGAKLEPVHNLLF